MTAPSKRPSEAWHSHNLFDLGLGHIVVARFKADGNAELGVFLVDVFCRGVRDAFFARQTGAAYATTLDRIFQGVQRTALSPACARKLVEDAVAYALDLGFNPHPDYRVGARVFGGIVTADCATAFTFGSKGKPCFIQGPRDTPDSVEAALALLERRCGPDGFDFTIEAPIDPEQ